MPPRGGGNHARKTEADTKKNEAPYQGASYSRVDRTYAAIGMSASGLLVRWYPPQNGHWYTLSSFPDFVSRLWMVSCADSWLEYRSLVRHMDTRILSLARTASTYTLV